MSKMIFVVFSITFLGGYSLAQKPSAFNLLSPENGAWATVSPEFYWSTSSGATSYKLYIDNLLVKDNIGGESYLLGESESLTPGIHVWKVVAVNSAGTTNSTQTWSVKIDGTPPGIFNLISPIDGKWTSDFNYTFEWNRSIDDDSGIDRYELYINDGYITNADYSATILSLPFYESRTVLKNGSNTWYIKAFDAAGNERRSNTHILRIDHIAPSGTFNTVGVFNGISSYIEVANSTSINSISSEYTIEAWVYIIDPKKTFDITSGLITKSRLNGWQIFCTNKKNSGGNIFSFEDGIRIISSKGNIPYNKWIHFAITRVDDVWGGVFKLYIDGQLDNQVRDESSRGKFNNTYSLLIGKRDGVGGISDSYFNGMIDEVRIWSKCKSQIEIDDYKSEIISDDYPDLVGYWRFNDLKISNTIIDFSKNGNNGVQYNVNQVSAEIPETRIATIQHKIPSSGELIGISNPRIEWASANDFGSGIMNYSLYVDNILVKNDIMGSSHTIEKGLADGNHSFQIYTYDKLGNYQKGPHSSFIVDTTPPKSFSLISPSHNSITNLPTPDFIWNSTTDELTGVRKYQLWLDGKIDIDSIFTEGFAYEGTSPSEPLSEGYHQWKIIAIDNVGNQQSSETRTVIIDYNPPSAFNLISPTTPDSMVSGQVSFKWRASKDNGSGLANYKLTLSGFVPVVIPATDTTYKWPSPLNPGVYTWSVLATDKASSTKNSSQTNSFTVISVPAVPSLVSPLNKHIFKDTLDVLFKWNLAANAKRYHLKVASDSLFASVLVNDSLITSLTKSAMLPNYGNYFWQVRERVGSKYWSQWSEVRKFTTILTSPVLLSPSNNAQNIKPDSTLYWNYNSGLFPAFRVQIAEDKEFKNIVLTDSVFTTSKKPSGLAYNRSYFWRVRAETLNGISQFSPVFQFKTLDPVPHILPIGKITINEDDSLSIPLNNFVSDFDSPKESLIWSATVLTGKDTILVFVDQQLKQLKLKTGLNLNGDNFKIELNVTDGFNSSNMILNVKIKAVNDPPKQQTQISDLIVLEDFQTITLPEKLSKLFLDVDSDNLAFTVKALNNIITASLNSDEISLKSKQDLFGQERVVVICSDGEFTLSDSISISVNPINDAPIVSIPNIEIQEDETKEIDLDSHVTDVDTDTKEIRWMFKSLKLSDQVVVKAKTNQEMEITVININADSLILSFNDLTHFLSVTGSPNYYGTDWAILVTATDDSSATGQDTISVKITPVNDPPFLSKKILDISVAEDFGTVVPINSFLNYFSDPDSGDVLIFTATSKYKLVETRIDYGTLSLKSKRDLNGIDTIIVTCRDKVSSISIPFEVRINPVNDAPESGHLFTPDDNMVVGPQEIVFNWEEAKDIDSDSLEYEIYIVGEGVNEHFQLKKTYFFYYWASLGKLKSNSTYSWFVTVSDGEFISASKDTFSFSTPQGVGVENHESHKPITFDVHQNYPNPFNPETQIPIEIPEQGNLEIIIFDLYGRKVVQLENKNFSSGRYQIKWNGKNSENNSCSSGVYFLRAKFTSSGKVLTKTKTMILMK